MVDAILTFFEQSPLVVVRDMYGLFGWLFGFYLLLQAGLVMTAWYKRRRYISGWTHVLLAIDIPFENVQTPKAVEQMFSHMYSIMEPPSIGFVYRRGFCQFSYSLEIVSIGGYIQFLIRTLEKYRDVVEAAVYAQYPDAEITEVEDYVNDVPHRFPNETHQIFAAEYVLINHEAFPIRTYSEFEHNISKDTVLKDPVGTILESFTRIGPGEQLWFQLVIEPIQEARWKKHAIHKIKEMIGEKEKHKGGIPFIGNVSQEGKSAWEELSSQVFGTIRGEAAPPSRGDDGPPNQILYMTPGQKTIVEQMEDKIRKLGFESKLRMIYVARKEVYNPARCVNSFTGAINQFTIPTSNALLPKYLTATQYFFAEQRKDFRRNVLMHAYVTREVEAGKRPYVLNIEELATIWHFPMSHVKTPLVQKALGKRAEPPPGLPVEALPTAQPASAAAPQTPHAPAPRAYQTDAGDTIVRGGGPQQFG